jgi:ribosome maturation protein Sdo1
VSKRSYVVAWIEVKGERFEILVKPEQAFRYKEGEKLDLNEVLWTDTVYKDSRKGLKASPESLKKCTLTGWGDVMILSLTQTCYSGPPCRGRVRLLGFL